MLCRYILVTSGRLSGIVQICGEVIESQVLRIYTVTSERVSGTVQVYGDK